MKIIKILIIVLILNCNSLINSSIAAEDKVPLLKQNWSFQKFFGTFDRASLQRGYQVYAEVCASCHSMKYVYYRNLAEDGGPEFSQEQAKAIASNYEVIDGPNSDGEMFTRSAKLSDKFAMPYANVEEAKLSNGGAYPPDMSVLLKARAGGANYIYSVLLGYEDPPEGMKLDDGVYYNKYMYGNKIKMPKQLYDDLVTYADGTAATPEQMAKDVTTFMAWTAEPKLEERHKIGFKAITYLFILTILVYFSMKKIWSRIETKI